ncbi:MAG: thiamine pyrophosphate-binding protein [Elusimicrobia bacterium]|nr:thiamine pyrophosphate-binding protein [Elusimicrobiota bacterium]
MPPAPSEKTTAIRLLLKYLEAENVKYIFGVPGGPLMPLYEAIFESGAIRPILAKHEQGAAFMADGYARVSGGLGVCCATTGPGGTNLMTGVACAHADSIPLLVLTAQIATGAFAKGAVQESTSHGIDLVEMFKPVTKMSVMLVSSGKMADMIRLAIRTAMTGRRGPVHLNLPADIVRQEVACQVVPSNQFYTLNGNFDREKIKEASHYLLKARKPAILVGNGVNLSQAHEEIRRIAEKLMIPVATSPKAKGAFPEDHLLSLGVLGFAGSPQADAYFLSGDVDVLLVAGCSLGEFSTHTWDPKLQPTSALIQIDIDPKEIGKNYPTAVGIVGDAKVCLRELGFQLERDRRWLDSVTERPESELRRFKEKFPRYLSPEKMLSEEMPLKPQRLIHEMREVLPPDTLLFVDIGNCIAWSVHYFPISRPNTFFLNLGMASMGHAVAAAIGGRLASGGKPVVALVGDAAFAMNGMEVHTAVDHNVPVVWVVANNGGHGMVYHGEKVQFKGKFVSSRFHTPLDIARIVEGMGALAFRAQTPEELRQALRQAMAAGRPAVIDARVDPEEMPPMRLRIEALDKFFAGEVGSAR